MRLVYGEDRAVAAWVARHLPMMGEPPEPCTAIGMEEGGALIGGAVFHNYVPEWGGIEMSVHVATPHAMQRGAVRAALGYCFVQLRCRWVLVKTAHTNERALRLAKGLGFVQRGVLPDFFAPRAHAVFLTMTARCYERRFARS